MDMTTNQAIQNLILAYLEDHPTFLETIKQKFALTTDETTLPMVDDETDHRIGEALEHYRHGEYIVVNPGEDIGKALENFDELLKQQSNAPTQI